MKHILIDFENVQPEPAHFNSLDDHCHIWLFLGKLQQKTLPVEFCEALCRFGKNVHFIRIAKTGKNALDFYLTYYLGKITEKDHHAEICILSRDGGFDVVIDHISENQLCQSIVRLEQLSEENKSETGNQALLSVVKAEPEPEQEPKLLEEPNENTLLTFANKVGKWIVFSEDGGKVDNLYLNSFITQHILRDELSDFSQSVVNRILDNILQKLLGKGVLTELSEKGNYKLITFNEFFSLIKERVLISKAKTSTALKNVIVNSAKGRYVVLDNEETKSIIQLLKQDNILRENDSKIEYAPFKTEEKNQTVLVKEDNEKLKKILGFMNKWKNKPSNQDKLSNAIRSHLKIDNAEGIIQLLIQHKKIGINTSGNVTYSK